MMTLTTFTVPLLLTLLYFGLHLPNENINYINQIILLFQGKGLLQLQPTLAGAVVGDWSRDPTRKLRFELLLLQVREVQPARAGTLHLSLHEAAGGHRKFERS